MKNSVLLFLFLGIFTFCNADEPPSWQPYKVVSENQKYFAWIDYSDKNSLKQPWERQWQLSIYSQDSTLVWQKKIQPTGYPDGNLTNDGNAFVIVETWYYDQHNLVSIYHRNGQDFFMKGRDFHISPHFLQDTESHRLWIDDFYLKNDTLYLTTLDKKLWKIPITQTIIPPKASTLPIKEIIAVALMVFVLIIVLLMRRRK